MLQGRHGSAAGDCHRLSGVGRGAGTHAAGARDDLGACLRFISQGILHHSLSLTPGQIERQHVAQDGFFIG